MEDYIQQVLTFDVRQGEPVRVEKMVAFYTSHDRAINETLSSAGKSVSRYPSFAEALERHGSAWEELWEVCDLRLPGNARVQLLLRLHISHILQVCSRHTADLDAGVPRAVSMARCIAGMCSGTSSTSTLSSASGCPR
jgi:trehalose/maltose hydrolase-like predicted phosphorylase